MPRGGNTTQRGYGHSHRQERDRWKPLVDAGQVSCWRCGSWLNSDEPWDLGHDDHDRSLYRGPECRSCNRSAAARKGNTARCTGQKVCAVCGSLFKPWTHDQTRCSAECRRISTPSVPKPLSTGRCQDCGTGIAWSRGRRTYCTECAHQRVLIRQAGIRAAKRNDRPTACISCGTSIEQAATSKRLRCQPCAAAEARRQSAESKVKRGIGTRSTAW